jgi:hypothetical protein
MQQECSAQNSTNRELHVLSRRDTKNRRSKPPAPRSRRRMAAACYALYNRYHEKPLEVEHGFVVIKLVETAMRHCPYVGIDL